MKYHQESDHDTVDQPLSKTRRKEAMHALQSLGERLVELPAARLAGIDMPESLRDAILEAQRLTSHEGKRRQMQYVGKLMRDADPGPIEAAIAAFDGSSAVENARFHRLERLREQLLDDEATLSEIADTWPGADLQHLRQLRRNALKERQLNKPPRNFRALFQALKELDAAAGAPAPDDEE
jgi:ribosome-associated protein